jgi:hypothetical protein
VREVARRLEPDRYLAALLSPRRARQDLVALAAFFGEMAHIPRAVSDPIIGEIRLQWWRDALANVRAGAATGSPVADALGRAIVRHALPEELLLSVIDGRARGLDPGRRGQTWRPAFTVACNNETEGAAFRLSARCSQRMRALRYRICLRPPRGAGAPGSSDRPRGRTGAHSMRCIKTRKRGLGKPAAAPPPRRRPSFRPFCPLPSWSPIWRVWRGLVPT